MSSDEDMSGSESEYSYHSQSEDEGDYGGGAGEGKCNGATSNGEPYTVLSKHDLNKHKSEVRLLFSSLSNVAFFCFFQPHMRHIRGGRKGGHGGASARAVRACGLAQACACLHWAMLTATLALCRHTALVLNKYVASSEWPELFFSLFPPSPRFFMKTCFRMLSPFYASTRPRDCSHSPLTAPPHNYTRHVSAPSPHSTLPLYQPPAPGQHLPPRSPPGSPPLHTAFRNRTQKIVR